ncbi:ZBT24-like protein [Mya arenaria]|uniref:ZBT24-like protein n=1 Tax=Mya arenaria TaxID=6604 RepID=A0ABY7F0L1_MYAAR|nr:ZBT24-like protein [Mya arenaria]
MSSAPKKRKIEIVKETVVKETKSKDTVAKEAEVKETESKETVVKETESKDKSDDEENNQEKLNTVIAKTDNESEDPTMSDRKKDSVENEFQRLVNEAMEEVKKAKKEGDSGKQERYVNLRKRLNETVRYNLDDSEDELDKQPLSFVSEAGTPKAQKVRQGKGIAKTPKSGIKTANQGVVTPDTAKKELKKDVDVYDFTDTEMSDHEDPSGFKPKYVSNIQKSPIGAKKLPFVSTPLSQNQTDEQQVSEELPKDECEDVQNVNDDKGESATYDIAKTVEPLKIKLSKIKPFKEKRHKHKKKKKKKDRDRKDCVREDYKSDLGENSEGSNIVPENSDNSDIKPVKLDNVKSVESVGMESVSNDGDDENGTSDKQNKKPSKLKEKKHICEFCNLGFSQKCDLRRHVMIHTVLLDIHKCIDPSKNIYICSECYEEFIDETLYAEHIKTHDLGVIACNVCTLIFSDKHSLETHLCTLGVDRGSSDSDKTPPNREDDKPVQVLCEICDLEFNDQDQLSLHLPSHDNDKGSFMCDLCSEIFTVRKRLKQHSSVHERGQQEAIVGSGVNKEQSTVLENSQKRNLRDKRPSS